jgi:hypothetical protein
MRLPLRRTMSLDRDQFSCQMFRISRNGQEPIIDVDQVEAIEPANRWSEPGRYHVDEISADPLPA